MTATFIPRPLEAHREAFRQLTTFGAIGVASTLAYVLLYAGLRVSAPAGVANALALLITAVGNTAANRWLTFRVSGREGLARDHAAGLLAFGAALAITSASLVVLDAIAPHHDRLTEIAVLVGANAAATLVRFLLLRFAVSTPRRASPARMSTQRALATLSQSERTRG